MPAVSGHKTARWTVMALNFHSHTMLPCVQKANSCMRKSLQHFTIQYIKLSRIYSGFSKPIHSKTNPLLNENASTDSIDQFQ